VCYSGRYSVVASVLKKHFAYPSLWFVDVERVLTLHSELRAIRNFIAGFCNESFAFLNGRARS